ncbi:protease, putative [Plasmodium berghei]|uniref:Protease, putative n=2 Tax=Plasmodium berghei TaxID=5821 RepID=A0A509ANM2_PLABA|nr:protease, putative [Plasmodium berghei ANKA]CXI31904.1 protease, putative [Plasmodium berghei]SCM21064.1 protease, putative [Plasmodium berghei]SCN24442.1 protease, putative [Plasmodium berghei]SCO59629.1 protease, putative [Plasmodium berghei]SCO60813.1 protease, putative [Plasmodium berghei]|eukprot:XP_034421117.1 protease, putative [Plasmodium berghei ANKA]
MMYMVFISLCFNIICCIWIKGFKINKNSSIILHKYKKIEDHNKVNSFFLRKIKQTYTYKKFSVNLKPDDESVNNIKERKNIIKENIFNFYKKNIYLFSKILLYMKNGATFLTEKCTSSIIPQLLISISFFFLHFYLLSKNFIILLPYQLIPNYSNILMGLDFNSTFFIFSSLFFLKNFISNFQSFKTRLASNKFTIPLKENKKKNILTISVLFLTSYILSGYVSIYAEQILNYSKSVNFRISDTTIKSLQILIGHFVWVGCSIKIFSKFLYPHFKNNISNLNFRYKDSWCFKVIYGYVCSHYIFNIIDLLNNTIINYFNNDDEIYIENSIDDIINEKKFLSTFLCVISPCFSAPFFEEFIYRFFVLKSLCLFMNIHYAVTFSSLLFAIHHLNIFNVIPLFFLSFFWSYIYIYTDNILITMIIHSFWNIYVFLSSLYN